MPGEPERAVDSVVTQLTEPLCQWCHEPLPPPTRKPRADQPRRFCSAAHRAAWHKNERLRKAAEIFSLAEAIVSKSRDLK